MLHGHLIAIFKLNKEHIFPVTNKMDCGQSDATASCDEVEVINLVPSSYSQIGSQHVQCLHWLVFPGIAISPQLEGINLGNLC